MIQYFAISTSPIIHLVCPPKPCKTLVFISPGYYSPLKGNKRQFLRKILGGKPRERANKVYHGRCENGEYNMCFFFFLLAIKYFDISGCNRCKNSLAEMKRTGSPRPSLLLINRDPFYCLLTRHTDRICLSTNKQ